MKLIKKERIAGKVKREYGLSKTTPEKDLVRMEAITLRKQDYSIYNIQALLKTKGHITSHTGISGILREKGFARLPKGSKAEVSICLEGCALNKSSTRKWLVNQRPNPVKLSLT